MRHIRDEVNETLEYIPAHFVVLSLVHTAQLNGLEPGAWLRDVLEKLPSWPASRLDDLLPYRRQAD